jgi:CheY-like chemotaxis protein
MDHLNPQPDERESKRTPIPEQDGAKREGEALSHREERCPASSGPRQYGGEIILLVEAEELLRSLLSTFLRNAGYRVLEASNAMEAIGLWEEQRGEIDLLYTDMTMPGGMNGSDLCRRLRLDKPGLKVIIWSGYTTEVGIRRDATGIDIVYMPKPCASQVVVRAIQAYLANKQFQMEKDLAEDLRKAGDTVTGGY